MGQRVTCLALPGADRISGRGHRYRRTLCLVHCPKRSAGRTFESESDNESVKSAVVFPRAAGDAGLL